MDVREQLKQNFGETTEVSVDANGGKQARILGAFELLPGRALEALLRVWRTASGEIMSASQDELLRSAYEQLAQLLSDDGSGELLGTALAMLCTFVQRDIAPEDPFTLPTYGQFSMAMTIERGAQKYGVNNWRRIDYAAQVRHALSHLLAYLAGNRAEDHIGNAICRIGFAIEVDPGNYRFTAEPQNHTESTRTLTSVANITPLPTASLVHGDDAINVVLKEVAREMERQVRKWGRGALRYMSDRNEAGLVLAEEILEANEQFAAAALRAVRRLNDHAPLDELREELVQVGACAASMIVQLDEQRARAGSELERGTA